ncbi:GH92 family glycosyl hydrolase [Puia dinghuensis]|uniref:LamG-like jellyroll fold domain-containing protein n=1 Tax=Puia dinghuensis TaxID=1792502 RepID=A0A8J2XQC4_9BACT|nr:GH92 family glycosyl hydrolase [Puia dinghuensis]GGA91877.1 hypothetical protein GCM10011511_14060 [Puia dinghuensis]
MHKLVFAAALTFWCQAAFSQVERQTPPPGGLGRPALTAFLQRVVKDRAGLFEVEYVAPEGGKDVFEVESRGGRVVLRGSNGVSVASALNYYLRHYCHCLITWNGSSLHLPVVLPLVKERVHRKTPYDYRYYLNYCTFNYSMAWWDWDRWQREIDWMAMNGINMPLALTGEEAIWQEVYRGMGFTDKELDAFFSGPAYFSWLWMGNIDAWGGPLPAHWKESHKELQKKILVAERAFGMKPVLPAFTGHVPPSFQARFPAAKVKRTNWGAGFPDVYILDPGDPMFEAIGRRFIEVQKGEYGSDHLYSADTFNENVPPTTDSTYLDAMSKKVYASMAAADPAAVWVMQGWMFHYNASYWQPVQIQALLKAVPDDHMILLDLYSESHPVWNRTNAYYGKPWIWNILHNFGGNISLWGRMSNAAADPSAALHDPASGKMVGIGLTPEGIEQNPALYQLMLENVWQDGAVDVGAWLKEYARERYSDAAVWASASAAVRGGASEDHGEDWSAAAWASVDEAWKLLEGSVYHGGLGEGGPESIIQARPTFDVKIDRVLTHLDYDPAVLARALGLFVKAAPILGKSDGFRYDLVDMTRQVLANYASPLQQQWVAAWKQRDTVVYRRCSREFLALMDDMDRLLATRTDFLLGKWIHDARACGVSSAEKDLYEKNARDLITLWGDKESELREYSNRQWSGLIKGFYKRRWELLFARLDRGILSGEMDWAAFDKEVKDWEWHWVNGHEAYASRPEGDAVEVATELFRKYAPMVEGSNDHIFPAAAVAKPYIDFDEKGFLVKGKRCFLVSAGMEYARVPHQLWRDRLQRLQRAGFNCVEVYTFWNFHEPQEGKFDFSGDHDLEAFLRLVGEMGMYAIVRVGPYYCAEWDNGGYPLWLRFKPGVRVREDNTAFLRYVDRYFDRLLPIVCRQQIQHGGPVILVQLENEHQRGWGTAMPDGYFRHLQSTALEKGLEVPYFFSGLHHASDPAGDGVSSPGVAGGDVARLDDPSRPNPWFSTEFWSVWYNGYGAGVSDSAVYARRTWKIIVHGGGGYNYYMAHGGSNFGYTNNDEDAASYDYSAAVGQAGDLRPMYYAFKRAALFARSFQGVLADGVDATAQWKGLVKDTGVRVTARHSVMGDVVFLDNPGVTPVRAVVRGVAVVLAPGEILPVVHHFAVSSHITLEWAPVRVMGIVSDGASHTMVVEGEEGRPVRLEFIAGGRSKKLDTVVSAAPVEVVIRAGDETLRVLVVSRRMADQTWFVESGGKHYVVCGADYVGDVRMRGKMFSVGTETFGGEEPGGLLRCYGAAGEEWVLRSETRASAVSAARGDMAAVARVDSVVLLSPWRQKVAGEPAAVGFDDRDWLHSERPLQMGADGNVTPDAWYRAIVRIDVNGDYTLRMQGGDRATVFVDGAVAGVVNLHEGEAPLRLTKGEHTIAVFTAHDGRDKLAGFLGSMEDADPKGLGGEVRLERGAPSGGMLAGWRFLRAAGPGDVRVPLEDATGWSDYKIGDDAFDRKEGFGWFGVVLPEPPAGANSGVLDFRSTDENATIFLNGHMLLRHEGWNIPFRVNLDRLDTLQRPLVLTVFIENYSNEGGIDRPVRVHYFSGSQEITGWRMRGGIAEPGEIVDWLPLDSGQPGVPCYYRSEFRVPRYGERGEHPIFRVHVDGLGHGSVWVNGHNLGRYPEKTPAPGLYIPECWLKAGANELVIYDEDGRRPDSVTVRKETVAGRRLAVYSTGKGVMDYVDPMIGTAKSDVVTKWGNEGGTYPGAVAPWGFVQMTPETRAEGGYDHADDSIAWFSCIGHMSGWPGGSAGRGRMMPVVNGLMPRAFLHEDEVARPGYYRVLFRDNNTTVETTASERVGWMRCTFPEGVAPRLFVGGLDGVAVLHFSRAIVREEKMGEGKVLTFVSDTGRATVVEIAIAVSTLGAVGAEANFRAAGERHRFDEVEQQTWDKWRKALSIVEVEDEHAVDKTIFYTALYHSLLLPWIISDADGKYRGRDGLVHQATGASEYGGFSPWDSFRSQQPLLTLLFPGVERDIILSMLDVYRQTGYLPAEAMTGNHSIPIIADAYLKGIRGFDPAEAYKAMRKGTIDAPYRPVDREVYGRLGYVPRTYPESVTRTVEYAYDDWAISAFAADVARHDHSALRQAGYNYRNLFDASELFFLPREGDRFFRQPGTSGYKEGDQWAYTYFVPQHPEDLINLLGGRQEFVRRLDSALASGAIVFDNETVFHVPYLFNYAGAPGKTLEWVAAFRDGRFSASPGGLPGNDDLGAFSSWYVFSAMGFFPFCPGRPEYTIGAPLFHKVSLHLADGRMFVINATNGRGYDRLVLADSVIRKGGEMMFGVGDSSVEGPAEEGKPAFVFSGMKVSKEKVAPDELFKVRFTIRNMGSLGTAIVVLKVNGREYERKNCLVAAGDMVEDSMDCRLYAEGKNVLEIEGMERHVEVVGRGSAEPVIKELAVRPLVRVGERQSGSYCVQNIDGVAHVYRIAVDTGEGRPVRTDTLTLQPGEKRRVAVDWVVSSPGLREVRVGSQRVVFKVFRDAMGSLLLSLSLQDSLMVDRSGYDNVARMVGSGGDRYVEVAPAPSLDTMGETITMAAWVYPVSPGEGLVDILTKGDHHVLQVQDNRRLSFFAGGWGRGDCTVDLPADWFGHWHHIAGVCTGDGLKVYIDGELKGRTRVAERVNLSVANRWVLGRNEEFPGERVFKGLLDKVQVWAEALNDGAIRALAAGR